MLQRGDKFSVEERSSLALIQTTLRTVAKTLISFHQVDHTYDRLFLVKFLTELETLLKDLIRPHLTEKSVGRVEQVGFKTNSWKLSSSVTSASLLRFLVL